MVLSGYVSKLIGRYVRPIFPQPSPCASPCYRFVIFLVCRSPAPPAVFRSRGVLSFTYSFGEVPMRNPILRGGEGYLERCLIHVTAENVEGCPQLIFPAIFRPQRFG